MLKDFEEQRKLDINISYFSWYTVHNNTLSIVILCVGWARRGTGEKTVENENYYFAGRRAESEMLLYRNGRLLRVCESLQTSSVIIGGLF